MSRASGTMRRRGEPPTPAIPGPFHGVGGPPLDREEEADLAARARAGCVASMDRIVRANVGLVVRIAAGQVGRGVELDDLIAEGFVGLMAAVERFDPAFGAKLSTYSTYWIRQKVGLAIIASRRCRVAAVSMVGDGDALADDGHCPASIAEAVEGEAEGRSNLAASLDGLHARDREVLTSRFGIGRPRETLDGIGRRLGLCKERVRQIELAAKERLARIIEAGAGS